MYSTFPNSLNRSTTWSMVIVIHSAAPKPHARFLEVVCNITRKIYLNNYKAKVDTLSPGKHICLYSPQLHNVSIQYKTTVGNIMNLIYGKACREIEIYFSFGSNSSGTCCTSFLRVTIHKQKQETVPLMAMKKSVDTPARKGK